MKGKSNLLNKMMAMLLTAALIIGMVVGAVPEEVHAEKDGDYEYTLTGENATITQYNGWAEDIQVPETLGGYEVTAIGEKAFDYCYSLRTVTISEGVTSIGASAFYGCSNLATVIISGSVTSIGASAFESCSNLIKVTINGSVTSIGASAFRGCYCLSTVQIPESVTSIGVGAFSDTNSNLTVTYGSCKHNWNKINNNDETLKDLASNNKVQYNPDPSESLKKKEAKAATCTEAGYEAYYECSGCGQKYEDDKGETPIDGPTIIPAKGHTPTDAVEENRVDATCTQAGSYDEVVYCSVCNEVIFRETKPIEKKAHSYGNWTVTKQSTESEEGLQERSCSVCGYKQTEVIPKTGSTGNGDSTGGGGNTGSGSNIGKIETEEEQGKNAPNADFKTSNDDLISAVLTPEEQSLVEAGTDVKIILDIDNIDSSVNPSDKQAVTDKADGYNVGQYLDINLYKIIGEDRTKVSQTNGKIKIAIAVPDSLKNTDSAKTRSFAVVRVHDGVAELLTDLDNDGATITFETDMFSTYAIVYKDTVNTDKKDDEPKTGDSTPMELYATLAMIAGLSYLLLFLRNRKRGMKEQ